MTDWHISPGDLGLEAVRRIFGDMQIDEEWSVREDRAFTWWGAWVRQRVWAGEAVRSGGDSVWHVRARTPALRDQPDDSATYAFVNDANALTSLTAYAFDPADGTVSARCGAFISESIAPWATRYLSAAVALQASFAWLQVPQIAGDRSLDSAPDHPTSGPRHDPDEMLNVAYSWPRAPLPFGPAVLQQAAEVLAANGLPVAYDDEPGGLRALVPLPDGEPATWGLVATDHPLLGRGAMARLVVPRKMGRKRAATIANALNLAESADWTGDLRPHALGAWTAGDVLVHSAFFPSVLFGRTEGDEVRLAMQNLLAWAAVRARFVGERLPWLEMAALSRYPDDEPVEADPGAGERATPGA